MTKQTALVLGCGLAEVPIVEALHEMDYPVATIGNVRNGAAHQIAEFAIVDDFSSLPIVLAASERFDTEIFIPGANDFAALTASKAAPASQSNLHDDFQVSSTIHHKDKLRAFLTKIGVHQPKSIAFRAGSSVDESIKQLTVPVIVKPVDLSGGKGIAVCNSIDQVDNAARQALARSREEYVIIEEYFDGTPHAFSAFVHEGAISWSFMDDEIYDEGAFWVRGTRWPASLTESERCDIHDQVTQLINSSGMCDGPLHVQFLATQRGPIIIEVCRRLPGDLYPKFVQAATGFDYARRYVRHFLGLPPETGANAVTQHVERFIVKPSVKGPTESFHFAPALAEQLIAFYRSELPDETTARGIAPRIGIAITKANDESSSHESALKRWNEAVVFL